MRCHCSDDLELQEIARFVAVGSDGALLVIHVVLIFVGMGLLDRYRRNGRDIYLAYPFQKINKSIEWN